MPCRDHNYPDTKNLPKTTEHLGCVYFLKMKRLGGSCPSREKSRWEQSKRAQTTQEKGEQQEGKGRRAKGRRKGEAVLL